MRNFIIGLALIIGSQAAMAATITARVSATILNPVTVSLQQNQASKSFAGIDPQHLKVVSTQNLSYDLSRNSDDVCLFKTPDKNASGRTQLLASSCESVVVNFN